MKQIPLTHGEFAIVDDEDFPYLNRFSWHLSEYKGIKRAQMRIRGNHEDGSARNKATTIYIEQFLLTAKNNFVYAHINKNSLDCRKENLVLTSKQHTLQRGKKRKNTFSKYKGVAYHKNKKNRPWSAQVSKDCIHYGLGYFETEKEAGLAYNKKALELYGELAYQNKID